MINGGAVFSTDVPNTSLNTISWSTGDTTSSITVSPTQTTNYSVTVDNGITTCTDSVTVTVSNPNLDLGPDTFLACGSDSVILDAGTGYVNYNWNTGQVSQTIYVIQAGSYSVDIIDTFGCNDSDTLNISVALPTGHIDTATWIGVIDSSWFNPCNWDKLMVPDSTYHVLIPGSTLFQPYIVGDTAWCKTLTTIHQNGGHVTHDYLGGGKLMKKP